MRRRRRGALWQWQCKRGPRGRRRGQHRARSVRRHHRRRCCRRCCCRCCYCCARPARHGPCSLLSRSSPPWRRLVGLCLGLSLRSRPRPWLCLWLLLFHLLLLKFGARHPPSRHFAGLIAAATAILFHRRLALGHRLLCLAEAVCVPLLSGGERDTQPTSSEGEGQGGRRLEATTHQGSDCDIPHFHLSILPPFDLQIQGGRLLHSPTYNFTTPNHQTTPHPSAS